MSVTVVDWGWLLAFCSTMVDGKLMWLMVLADVGPADTDVKFMTGTKVAIAGLVNISGVVCNEVMVDRQRGSTPLQVPLEKESQTLQSSCRC